MKGFTLIEMLVAVALFSSVMIIAAGALLSANSAQQKILALRIVQDNLNYAFDTMARDIRVGTSYHCGDDISTDPADCPGGGSSFTFLNASGSTEKTYRLNNGALERILNGNVSSPYVLTSPDLIIERLKFYVIGSFPASMGDKQQPRVTVVLSGKAGLKEKTQFRLNVQMTISQRVLDL